MFYFKGCNCSICEKQLKENENIVVCPVCGTPYHRECYEKNGSCTHESEHASGFEYVRATKIFEDKLTQTQNTVTCAECHKDNNVSNIFCDKCGKPLHTQNPHYTSAPPAAFVEMPFIPGMPPIAKDETIDEISVSDWMDYTGTSGPYYIYQFKTMDSLKRKTGICWSAILFTPFYCFFRKMWAWGILAFLIMLGCNAPFFIDVLQKSGTLQLGLSEDFLLQFSFIVRIIDSCTRVLFGIFAIYLYRKSAGNVIRKNKSSKNRQAFEAWLKRSQGPSKIGLGIAILCVFILASVFVNIVGSEYIIQMYNTL